MHTRMMRPYRDESMFPTRVIGTLRSPMGSERVRLEVALEIQTWLPHGSPAHDIPPLMILKVYCNAMRNPFLG